MTREESKQNAEEYASKLVERDYHEDMWLDLYDAYIAGAQSMLPEIELHWKAYKWMEEKRDKALSDYYRLMNENQLLRNPWISVENRLPDKKKKDENYSVNCIVRYTDEYLFPGQVFYTEAYYDYGYEKKSPYNKGGWMATYNDDEHFFFSDYEENGCVVTHWMPIPELKKMRYNYGKFNDYRN